MLLTSEQRQTLYILGYLYIRMGLNDPAERLFKTILSLFPEDKWSHRNLAVIAMRKGDSISCLTHIYKAISGERSIAKHTPLLLLQAQALWHLGRHSEARFSIQNYIKIIGNRT